MIFQKKNKPSDTVSRSHSVVYVEQLPILVELEFEVAQNLTMTCPAVIMTSLQEAELAVRFKVI
jgi:hypothetical protein